MNKQKYKLLQNLMSLTIVTEIIGFVGLIIYSLGQDLHLEKTKELGCYTWLLTLIFAFLSFTFLIGEYYMKKKNKNNSSNSKNNNN